MRLIVSLLAVLTLALLATTGVVLFTPDPWKRQFSAAVSALVGHKPAESGTEAPAAKDSAAAKPAVVVVNVKTGVAPENAKAGIKVAPAVVTWPFPAAPEPQVGANRATVLDKFGQPNTAVTLADAGRLMECFIYLHKPSRRTTVIMLVNSTVVSTQTVLD